MLVQKPKQAGTAGQRLALALVKLVRMVKPAAVMMTIVRMPTTSAKVGRILKRAEMAGQRPVHQTDWAVDPSLLAVQRQLASVERRLQQTVMVLRQHRC
jgi:hypothetical protein